MNPVDVLREKVTTYLPKIVKSYEVRDNGTILVRQGSTAVFLEFHPWRNEESSILRLVAPVLFKVPDADALYRRMSDLNAKWHFGRIYKNGEMVFIDHCMLGDFLDLDELGTALTMVAFCADETDDKLKGEFGGDRFID